MAEKLKIIPLGGLNEIGKNMTAYEYGGEIIVVDCGMAFPGDDMYGIDLVIPDVSYLTKHKNRIRGLFITHGHEDHIGAIPYVLKQVNMPIYCTRLTAGLIRLKLEEHGLLKSTKIVTVEEIVLSSPVVQGIHDLIVHDYGPGRVMISLHAEVPAHGDIMALHDEIDNIEQRLRRELGCAATIHMDPIVTDDKLTAETRERVAQLVRGIDEHITIHDFRMVTGPTHTNVIFDAVVPFKFRLSDHEVEQEIQAAVKRLDSSYFAVVQIDRDYTK